MDYSVTSWPDGETHYDIRFVYATYPSTNIPTPPSDRNSPDFSSSPTGMRKVHQQPLKPTLRSADKRKAAQRKAALSPTPQDASSGPVIENSSQCFDYDEFKGTAAEILLSLQYAHVMTEESAYRVLMKQPSPPQQQEGIVGYPTDCPGSWYPSPESLLDHDNPSLEQEEPYDSDETEILDKDSSASTVSSIDELRHSPDSQHYDQAPSTRWSMRIHINREAKNLESNMNRTNSSSPPLKQKSKEDATWNAGVQQAVRSFQVKAGGPPKSDSKEDQQRYERNYTNAWVVREAEKPWSQLEQAEKFVKNMRKDVFEYPRNNREAKDPFHRGGMVGYQWVSEATTKSRLKRDTLQTPCGKTRSKTTAQNASSNINSTGKRKLNTKTLESVLEEVAGESRDPDRNPEVALEPAPALSQPVGTPPKKRRRRMADNLATDLGEKWKAHVDEHGHRPTRTATKKL
ncbi:hypothetical protein F5X96DRAFT_643351 [Biscogniauxia mediterranea]|nr:hypothetical protein F5X96DRAFT_643351 [Biscogniauxia mediterranea]